MDEEPITLIINEENTCRLCLSTKGAMSDIFEDSDDDFSLEDVIFHATGLKLSNEYGFPSKICHKCRYIVELNHEHRMIAEKTQELLQRQIEQVEYLDEEFMSNPSPVKRLKDTIDEIGRKTKKPNLKLILDEGGKLLLVKKDNESQEYDSNDPLSNDIDYNDDEDDLMDISKEHFQRKTISQNRERRTAPKNLTCQLCLMAFSDEDQVREHVLTHYENTNITNYLDCKHPFGCEACNLGPITKTKMIDHHRKHLAVQPYFCKHPGCSFIGKDRGALRHHEKIHSARKHVCEACGCAFKSGSELRLHRRRVHEAAPIVCGRCGASCRNLYAYRQHLRKHANPPRFKCSLPKCKKAFYSQYDAREHERAHANSRPYKCDMCCVAAFTNMSLLKRHKRAHMRNESRRCNTCAVTFRSHAHYTAHLHAEHDVTRPHRCPHCHSGCKSEVQLKRHLEKCRHAESSVDSAPEEQRMDVEKDSSIKIKSEECNLEREFCDDGKSAGNAEPAGSAPPQPTPNPIPSDNTVQTTDHQSKPHTIQSTAAPQQFLTIKQIR